MQSIDTILTGFVNDIRTSYIIVSSVFTDATNTYVEYTMNKSMSFVAGDIVNINGTQFLPVYSFNNSTKKFVVKSTTKIASGFVKKNPVFYFYGKENEITAKFGRYSKDELLKYQIFPIVWRVTPTAENYETNENVDTAYNIDLIIATRCESDKDTKYTNENIIIPVLDPIYESFIKQIKLNTRYELNRQKGDLLPHERTREILSRDEQNITAQFLAAIVIKNLKIETRKIKNCN